MKRITIWSLIAVLAAFGMAGCSDEQGSENNHAADAAGDSGADSHADPDTGSEEEDVAPDPDPEIIGMAVSPTTITVAQATDGSDTMGQVAIYIENFDGDITKADAFVETPTGEVNAPKRDYVTTGNEVQLYEVQLRWFRDLEPGDYDIGARLQSDAGEDVKQWGLATVTIVEE